MELDYFTTRGCREAAADSNKSVSQDTLTFTQVGDTFAICPMAALRPSKQIRNDEDLSWEEMMDAKNVMLHFMAKSGIWEDEHATALASFYINLNCHPRKEQKNGKMALLVTDIPGGSTKHVRFTEEAAIQDLREHAEKILAIRESEELAEEAVRLGRMVSSNAPLY